MIGCHLGRFFQVSVAGGSYQEGLVSVVQGVPAGMAITEQEIYGDLLLRKPGSDELSSPRKEPDLPIIYAGVNAADTVENAGNHNLTNGTPLCILIPNLDRHFIHIKQYQDTNRTPRPGHASYASFLKYGPADDAIGAGIFSGRYTSTIVAPGFVAKKILGDMGIRVASYVKELAGVHCTDMDSRAVIKSTDSYKRMRHDHDPFYQEIYLKKRITPDMRFLEKMAILAQVENEIQEIREKAPAFNAADIKKRYEVHPILNCPDIEAADAMVEACNQISATGDSAGGLVEIVVTGMPPGVGEPVFAKLDGQLGQLLGIGAVKGVEIGAGFAAKDMTGYQCNDQMHAKKGKVVFDSNNAGGITGGLTTGQDIVIRVAIKPTPTIDRKQQTIDKYTLENKPLAAITRRDATIVARIWPVAENLTALILLDNLMAHFGYQKLLGLYNKPAKQ
ncbi:MAG: chorismate synthase [Deltaproteobacteria bacterium]|nr:chorismate synthase [Deltaproteobacteria bacterium]